MDDADLTDRPGWEMQSWLDDYQKWSEFYDRARVASLEDTYGDRYGGQQVNINEAFPSNYLKAADLQGKKVKVTISKVEWAELEEGKSKPAVHFQGKAKSLILNKTNSAVIASAYGPETDGWVGKEIILYPAKVPFQGQMTDALRVEIPQEMATSQEEPDW